jgi:integrase/recombinase XerD
MLDTKLDKQILLVRRHEEYLRRRGFALRTRESYGANIRKFMCYLKTEEKITDLKDVDRSLMSRYQSWLYHQETPLRLSTQTQRLIALRSFFSFLERDEILLYDPTRQIQLPKKRRQLPRDIFTEKEMVRILKAPDLDKPQGLRDRAILEIFYSTGIRSEELSNLDLYDLDKENEQLRIRQGKGQKDRVLPVGRIALGFLNGYIQEARPKLLKAQETEALFISRLGRRIHRASLPWVLREYTWKAKIRRYVRPHMIRHSVATHMLKRKAPIRYIQELLGHKDLNTTQVYTKVVISDLKRIHRQTHPRERA